MKYSNELKYSKTHEWVKMMDAAACLVGITDYAQSELGGLVFINLPQPADEAVMGEVLCDVESVKAVSDIISPVTGTISEVNLELMDSPEMLNDDPFGAWIVRIDNITATEELMDGSAYEAFINKGEG